MIEENDDFQYESKDVFSLSFSFRNCIHLAVKCSMNHHYDSFPMIKGVDVKQFINESVIIVAFDDASYGMPVMGTLKDEKLIARGIELFERSKQPSYEELKLEFPAEFSFSKFLYIGKHRGNRVSKSHFDTLVCAWLNDYVAGKILDDNKKRILDAIPEPPQYNLSQILNNIYVVESDSGYTQGTAFHLSGIGLITCDHCVRNSSNGELLTDVVIHKGKDFAKITSTKIVASDKDIDLAKLAVDSIEILSDGFSQESCDDISQMDHIIAAGFPNYRRGDEGIVSPGIITGFRQYLGFRHLLINAPLISGMSGGPILNKNNKVIGIAVTGADKMENAHSTEKHCVIPIDALRFIK